MMIDVGISPIGPRGTNGLHLEAYWKPRYTFDIIAFKWGVGFLLRWGNFKRKRTFKV